MDTSTPFQVECRPWTLFSRVTGHKPRHVKTLLGPKLRGREYVIKSWMVETNGEYSNVKSIQRSGTSTNKRKVRTDI